MAEDYCKIETCERKRWARGWCLMHYKRWRKNGDPEFVQHTSAEFTVEDRVRHYGWTVTENGCWEYNGRKVGVGYGSVSFGNKDHAVHRVAYHLWVGPIADGLFVMHSCDNPPCINPDHLSLGTNQDNMIDMVNKGRNKPMRGSSNPHSKLVENDVREIRRLRSEEGLTLRAIADRFGLSEGGVHAIVKRRSWTWLE